MLKPYFSFLFLYCSLILKLSHDLVFHFCVVITDPSLQSVLVCLSFIIYKLLVSRLYGQQLQTGPSQVYCKCVSQLVELVPLSST